MERVLHRRGRVLWVIGSIIVAVAAIVAARTLFVHTLPAVTTTPPILTSACTDDFTAQLGDPPIVGSAGYIVFTCPSTEVSFQVERAGSVMPMFSLASTGYVSLWRVSAWGNTTVGQKTCAATFERADQLLTFERETFLDSDVGTGWNYCAEFSSAPPGGFGSFTVEWTQ